MVRPEEVASEVDAVTEVPSEVDSPLRRRSMASVESFSVTSVAAELVEVWTSAAGGAATRFRGSTVPLGSSAVLVLRL